MVFLQQSVDQFVPVVLTDAASGSPYKNVQYNNVTASVLKSDGTEVDLTIGASDWTEITSGAYSQRGYYLLKIPASVLDQEGLFHYGVAVSGADFYPGLTMVRANTEKNIMDRIGAPVGSSISADISNVGITAGSGGFLSGDRANLTAIAAALPSGAIAGAGDVTGAVSSLETWMAANGFTSSDHSNLNAIKTQTDKIGTATVATQADVTSARDSVNTNTNSLGTALKGASWSSTNDTFHAIRTQIDTIAAKTTNLPTDPASQSAICGTGFNAATDTLHQLQLGITSVVTTSGGFTPDDRANIQTIVNALPPSSAQIAGLPDITGARDTIMGSESTYGTNVKRTVSETYVVARQVKAKTDYIQSSNTVATTAEVNAARDYLAGTGYAGATDSLHQIASALGATNFGSTDRTTLNGIATSLAGVTTTVNNNRTDIVAIRSKTDALPTDPASNSHIDTVIGAGANAFTTADHNMISDIQTFVHRLPSDPASQSASFGSSDRDVMSAIRSKTDLLPPDPASNTNLTALSNKIGTPHHSSIVGDMDYNLSASAASLTSATNTILSDVDALSTKVGSPRTGTVVGDVGEVADLSLIGS